MKRGNETQSDCDPLGFLAGGGEMGGRTRAFDWSKTPIGPVAGWPQSLKTAVRIMLDARYPMFVWWGPWFTNFYNDAYVPVLGRRHPDALGRPAAQVWADIWHVVGPQAEAALTEGRATWSEEQLLVMERNGFLEETYFTYSYSPVHDDEGRIAGVFCACTEDTHRVLGQRRLRTLRALADQTARAKTVEGACRAAAVTLAENRNDLPFALLYLTDDSGQRAILAGLTGLDRDTPASPAVVDLVDRSAPWPFRRVAEAGKAEEVGDLATRFECLSGVGWPEPPQRAVVVPMARPGLDRPAGFVVAGVSPRLAFNDDYRGFLELLAGHVAIAVANARAYEEERRRAESLAELDRAKTAFFSNVSHEFRTPLTLILGPLEDAIADEKGRRQRERLLTLRRNALRLQKLVNTLLDFSRIEAGRVRATYEPTDLAAFTADLASNFRSACERAGLDLSVDCPPLDGPVFVDRMMWEQVVLNLLSNAFKFTLTGGIDVTLRRAGPSAELRVRDTGTGIPPAELPRLFERFHRIEDARGRTHEGSGIGLALVQELVRLHGGSIAAESRQGEGTTFIVSIPFGSEHLPPERVGQGHDLASPAAAIPYVQEALRWLPDDPQGGPAELPPSDEPLPAVEPGPGRPDDRPRVLVADDNADMRLYVARLLAGRYHAEVVTDGEAALAAARERPPDLILSDVMMPRLDGFGLLKALRADPRTRHLPVILLSARAGEESRVEGMEARADDYLVKPFSGRELLARVSAHLQMARLRRETDESLRESEERFRALVSVSSDVVYSMSADWTEMRHLRGREFIADTHEPSRTWLQKYIHPDDRQHVLEAIHEAIRTRGVFELEHRVLRADGTLGWTSSRAVPMLDADGEIVEWFGMASDVTARKEAEEALQRSEERLRLITDSLPTLISYVDAGGIYRLNNRAYEEWFKHPRSEVTGRHMRDVLGESAWSVIGPRVDAALAGRPINYEAEVVYKGVGRRWIDATYVPHLDGDGRAVGLFVLVNDITARKQAEQAIRRGEERFRLLFETMAEGFAIDEVIFDEAGRGCDLRYLDVNPAFERHTGLRRSDILGRTTLELFPDAERLWFERFGKVASTGIPDHFQARFGPLGRWFEVSAYRTGPDQVATVFFDITEQKQSEERERRLLAEAASANAKFRAFFDQGPLFAGLMALDGTLLEANRRCLEECGYTKEQVIGKKFWECAWWSPSPGLMEIIRDGSARAAAGESFRVEMPYFVADGSRRMVDFILLPIKDEGGQIVFLAPTGTDITERKRAEERLRESELRYRLVGQAANDAIWDWDLATNQATWHEGVRRLFGYTPEQIGPDATWWSENLHPDDRERVVHGIHAAIDGGEELWQAEYRFRRADGSYAEVFDRGRVVREGGRPVRMVGSMLDLTERKQAEAALREADRRKDEFLATLAHELRNPLAPIRNALHLMRGQASDGDGHEAERAMAERQVVHLARLVDDLMDVARISQGKIELRKEVLDLADVVGRAVESARTAIDERGHRLTVELPVRPVRLEGDPTRLEQVLWNLLNNAAKYTEPGGRIALSAVREGAEVVVRVRDNGMGIDPPMLPRLFQMFVQVSEHRQHAQGGLGIGLGLVKSLVEMHGGSITAHSAGPGTGSEFVVRLPVLPTTAPVGIPSGQGRPGEAGTALPCRRILVVDDNADAANSLAKVLTRLYGQEVRVAHDGPGALEAAEEFQPEVVLLDIGLPGMDGHEVARQLRRRPEFKRAALVALTGWGQEADRRRSEEAGFDHHLVKPVDPEALRQLLVESRPPSRTGTT